MRLCGPNKCAKFFSYQWPNKKIHGVACFFVADLLADPVVFKNETNQPIYIVEIGWINCITTTGSHDVSLLSGM